MIFQVEELEGLNLETINYAVIESELQRQENMEELTSTLSAISDGLFINTQFPKIKIIDFLTSIFKMFNLNI